MRIYVTGRSEITPHVTEISDETSKALAELMKLGGRFTYHCPGDYDACKTTVYGIVYKGECAELNLSHVHFENDYD